MDLLARYREELHPKLQKELNYANPMQVPRLEKVTLNMGVGEAVSDRKIMDSAVSDLTLIAGQKAVVTKARKVRSGVQDSGGFGRLDAR